mmetsp:Transcript_14524/g.19872  ORF Transcript_14524/g.19872 Transcript_14524/m.19872 type:complete len:557 (-) Transcript_14524:162-1832(-)
MSETEFKAPFTTWSYDEPCTEMAWTEPKPSSVLSISSEFSKDETDLIIIGVFAPAAPEDASDDAGKKKETPKPEISGLAKSLDESLGGALSEVMEENYDAFKHGASAGSVTPTLRISAGDGTKAKKYVLLGLGTEDKDVEAATVFKVGSTIASTCNSEKKLTSCAVVMPPKLGSSSSTLTDISSSFYSSLYVDNRYRTGDRVKITAEDLTSVVLVPEESFAQEEADAALAAGYNISKGDYLTKDIVNAPHNVLNSLTLANTARKIAEESNGLIECTILGKEECEKRGMGSYLAVGRGSETEPQFIHLTYKPKDGEINKKVGVIGKGLLFDTGGYNIKTMMMELMKFDCGGSAAVLGAARATAALAPEGVEAHFIVAACENMINGKAMVPSDVLTASNGMTIEVDNTDAEGRLTLADALVYADKELECEDIIELSTLTGACMVALGKGIAGVFTQNDDLASDLADISKATGDKTWRMPLEQSYNDQLKSKIADIKNCGTRYGGAITAGLFLENFVNKKKPFAHIDIAGPVWDDSTGATGFGAKLVTEWVRRKGQKKE